MTDTGGQIKASPDALRATAASLRGVINEIDAELLETKGLHETTVQEASYGTTDTSPAPYFSPLLQALGTATGKVVKNIEQFKDNMTHDADVLTRLADAIESTEQTSAAKIANI